MRHLVVCCDGTWNTPEQEAVSNVRRLHNALVSEPEGAPEQLRYYHPGVGTEGGMLNWVRGGVTGAGLSRNVMDAYHWLTTTFEPGDRISLFGFSRGAYTVRSLAGMISACGLLDTRELDEPQTWRRIERVYHRRYQSRIRQDPRWREGLRFSFDPALPDEIPVRFIGVWETVGSLGIPDHLGWFNLLDPPRRHEFHDVTLNPYVPHARHAVAMDENRGPFAPTLWAPAAPRQDLAQLWFPGSHLDVGGCYPQRGLGDGPLQWMIDEAQDAAELVFHKGIHDQIRPDPLAVRHDDNLGVAGVFGLLAPVLEPALQLLFAPQPRAVPPIDPDANGSAPFHPSAFERHRTPPITEGLYWPTRVLPVGASETVTVSARDPWNRTGLYLDAGQYTFTAEGRWQGGDVWSGPEGGASSLLFRPGGAVQLLGTATGVAERVFRAWTGNEAASFLGARRVPDQPWMALVGVVANGAMPVHGIPAHEVIAIGAGTEHTVRGGGYLYAFANDAWTCYADNRDSVQLTVTRVA